MMKKLLLLLVLAGPAMASETATDASFGLYVGSRPDHVLVMWHEQGCAPCIRLEPEFESVAKSLTGKELHFVSIDVADAPKAAKDIKSVPRLVLYKDGKVVGECPERTAEKIKAWLRAKISP